MSRRLALRECIEETPRKLGSRNFAQLQRSFARSVAALTLFAAASWGFACREAVEPPRAHSVKTPPGASEISTETDFVGFIGSSGFAGTRARSEPAGSSAGEARGAEALPPPQTAGAPSVDSDAYVALDPDSEAKASETANDSSRLETGLSGDSMGQAALDSDAYALSRE